jgi:hypothetical protein
MPTDEELAQQGMAIFRGIVARDRLGLCVKRIARDRYCPERARPNGGLYCDRHWWLSEEEDRRIEAMDIDA